MKREELLIHTFSEWLNYINEYIFDERDRKLLKRRLLDNAPIKDLEKEFHLTNDAIRKRLRKAQKQLFKAVFNR